MMIICPRECPSPETEHCVGETDNAFDRGLAGVRCLFCGRYMPLAEAIDFYPDEQL
ncbi:MAG: hypothetical protein NUW01_06745 [Gemmatimonadaceae bacterium]|nr:hypothetical protein [Gemmatimonadaceae bacterium]